MSHEVENMMFVGETPWHGLGKRVANNLTPAEAIIEAGLDWGVEKTRLYYSNGIEWKPSERHALIRATDGQYLGSCGESYTQLQNTEMFNFFEPFTASKELNFETAGSLKNGKQVWVLAKLNKDPMIITNGDVVDKYLLLSNRHEAGQSVRVGFTPVRVVCMNTLAMSVSSIQSNLLRVWHSSKVVINLDKVRETINLANQEFEATAEQYRQLLKGVSLKDLAKYVKVVFYPELVTEEGAEKDFETERKEVRYQKLVERITELFETGKGNQAPGVDGTYWALYNGVTQYLNYDRGRTQDGRLESLWFGHSAEVNRRALEEALVMVR